MGAKAVGANPRTIKHEVMSEETISEGCKTVQKV